MDFRALELKRLQAEAPAGLWVCSLPWPRKAPEPLSLNESDSANLPIGRWPGSENFPRRILLVADGDNSSPPKLKLSARRAAPRQLPQVRQEVFESSTDPDFPCERSGLTISQDGRSIAVALGLRVNGEIHWWEGSRLVTVSESPFCKVIEMGGAIPIIRYGRSEYAKCKDASFEFVHRHNWVYGKIFARIYGNGVCEFFCRHINSKFVDFGCDFHGAVPIVGFRPDPSASVEIKEGLWPGQPVELDLGGVRIDLSDTAPLAPGRHPGRISKTADRFVILQPYEGMELYCGAAGLQRLGDPFAFRAEQQTIPNGMARTIRFSLSISDRSPKIARYLAPAWWYGLCEELLPDAILPAENSFNEKFDRARDWVRDNILKAGFEDGSIPRTANGDPGNPSHPQHEPGWEGDIAYGIFLSAWLKGDPIDHDLALRAAYYFADVAVDHSAKLVRMHGWPPGAFALPMHRVLGMLAAHLETGDPWFFDTARAVIDNAYWAHKDAWPRLAVGRDSCFIRGAVMLYRYFADEHYRQIARDSIDTVMAVQLPGGNFGDQGGGTGIHQRNSYVEKPWMGTLAVSALIDYLEVCGSEPEIAETVLRFGDWLLADRVQHEHFKGWCYQHGFNGTRRYLAPGSGDPETLPGPRAWHQESLARILGYCAIQSGKREYLDAWAESFEFSQKCSSDHAVSAALQYLPWLQCKLWNAKIDGAGGIRIAPLNFGPRTPAAAIIHSPCGRIEIAWEGKEVSTKLEPAATECRPRILNNPANK